MDGERQVARTALHLEGAAGSIDVDDGADVTGGTNRLRYI